MSYNPQNSNGQKTMANSAPIVIASDQTSFPIKGGGIAGTADTAVVTVQGIASGVAQPISGAVTMTSTTIAAGAATIAGLSTAKILSAATTNATNVKASQARLYGWNLTNTTASTKYVHMHATATAPTVGTTVPAFHIVIPPNTKDVFAPAAPITMAAGLGYSITGAAGDLDATAVALGDVVGSMFYV